MAEAKCGYVYTKLFVVCVGGGGCCEALLESTGSCQSGPNAWRWLQPETFSLETRCVQKCHWTVVDTVSGDGWVFQKTRPRPYGVYYGQGGSLRSHVCPHLRNWFVTAKQLQHDLRHATNFQFQFQLNACNKHMTKVSRDLWVMNKNKHTCIYKANIDMYNINIDIPSPWAIYNVYQILQ